MGRYFFDVREGLDFFPDDEGIELPSQAAAEAEAVATLAQLLRDPAQEATGQEQRLDLAIEVRTAAGPIFRAALLFAANEATSQ